MKKPTFSTAIIVVLLLLLTTFSNAQTYKTFSIRKNVELRGKMLVIGNNILGKDNSPFNDKTTSNEDLSMQYIDIDGDSNTFNSSSADLLVPNQENGSPTTCYRITYAALYWGAMLQSGSRTNINKVKLKLPGATTYNEINGTVVYDAISSPIVPDNNTPYACYADVTSLLTNLSSLTGTYTVADVVSSTGFNGSTGLSAGWTLFVIYEDPTLNMKSFTTFDGFSALYDGRTETIPVTGFRTPPSGSVDLQFAYAALDGDKTSNKSKLEFGTKEVSTPLRGPANNFFNSTIENSWGVSDPRNPSGSNTLGYDTGMLEVKNADPEFINNNQTSTSFTLQVAKGQADPVFAFFGAYAVDIIAPKIDLTKIVRNTSGTDIGGGNVNLAQSLVYEISYQSTGNDNVTNFTLKDVLPLNLVFDPATAIDYTNAGGATLQSYDAATRTLIFKIPDASVQVNDGLYTIRLNVQVAPDCNSLATACSNEIKNQAFATYQGVINKDVVQEEGSYASTVCKLGSPESTNFIVDISNCKFTKNVILCGSSVVLTAFDGYTNYSWSRNPDGSSPIGTGQTFTATQTGVYYVHDTAPLTCKDIVEQITVTYFGVTNTNPVIPFADQLVTCANDGKVLPNIFLCGANDSRLIKTGISDAASIVWEKLDEVSCPSLAIANCANENFASSCWKEVGTGPDYLANTSGQFRLTLNYTGGCFSQFYFNAYQNLLDPTFTKKDIICGTPGKITIGGVPTGYEFSLDGVNYQLNNPEFIITTAGNYTVYIKQQGVTTNPCIFQVPNILISSRTMNVRTFVTQPSCNGINDGSIKLIAENVEPQYYFSIEGTVVNSVGPIAANEFSFANLSPGNYTVKVWTDDNCTYTATVDIINPPLIKVTANVTKPLTCIDGEITIYIEGGTPNYNYYVNGTDVLLNSGLTSFTVPVSTAGNYDIKVDDLNNCPAITSVTVSAIPAPVYTVTPTNILCYGSTTGAINFNVTNANGYTLAYSIDNGGTYLPTPTFSNLAAGTYNTIVRYTLGTAVCYGAMEVVTITQPSTALTASAGVSELAGCGPSGEGKIRITNPQGGTPFPAPNYYLYSFDNQATWVTSNEAYMAPGTYTVYIKDLNGCIYPMPNVIIEPEPVAPTIDVASPVFNCDGSANSTVTITNPGGANFEYGYLLDGNVNTNVPSNVFVNVPSGPHTVSVTYKLLTVPTYSNLLKEDFGSGLEVSSPGINTNFCFEKQNFLTCDKNGTLNNGEYTVTNTIKNAVYSGWHNPVDHTNGSATGRYLAVDAGYAIPNNAVLYRKTIKDIIPNQPIQVRFYATNLLKVGNGQPDASLTVELQNSAGASLSSSSTGGIPKTDGWVEYERTIDPGNNTTLDFVLRLELAQVDGIDFAVDDIEVYQLPKTCTTQVDFPFIVPTGQAFSAALTGFKNVTCAGANNGEITIAAQNFKASGFQYTIDGINWINSTTSPVTITGLTNTTYNIQIRYDNTATTCSFPFTQVITAPAPLTITATVTSAATCITGATITAVGLGGTPAYQYELRESDGITPVVAFNNNNGVFLDVPAGNYTVFVRDANLCSVGAPVSIVAPVAPTATIVPSTAMCFDPASGAQITVNVSGGVEPYSYQTSTDGGTTYGVSSPTFAGPTFTYTATTTGTYMFKITDSNGCYDETVSQVINATVTANAVVTTGLDCDVAPANEAVITGTISGGTAPFVVTLLSGTGPGTLVQPAVNGTTFTYTTAVASTYKFQIQDAINCLTTSEAVINSLVPITLTSTDVNPKCDGASDGSIQLNPGGGSGGFTYSADGGANYNNTSFYSGLGAGTYTYWVKDSKNCTQSRTVILTAPAAITATAAITTAYTCDNTAAITASVSGGTAPYNYTLNRNGVAVASNTTGVFNNISVAGNYTVTGTDSNGCSFAAPETLTITALNPPANPTFNERPISCKPGESTSDVTVSVTGGTGALPLKYEITAPASAISNTTGATSGIFTGLTPGTYTFKVTDANNCSVTGVYKVEDVVPIIVSASLVSNVKCDGDSNGAVDYTISGLKNGVNYSYSIDGGPAVLGTTPVAPASTIFVVNSTGLVAGNHSLVIQDLGSLCTGTNATPIIINQPAALTIISAVPTNVNCNKYSSQIKVLVTGGTPNYSYAVLPAGSTATPTYGSNNVINVDTAAGTILSWDVYVKDANGCPAKTTIDITMDGGPSVTASATGQCLGAGNYTITANGTGGIGTLSYSINNGVSYQPGNTFVVTTAGNYTIKVKDANGCTSDSNTIAVATKMTLTAVLNKDITCNSASTAAQITLTTTGGSGSFTYIASPNTGSFAVNIFTTSTAGNYTFTVTDTATGCTYTTTAAIPVTAPVNPDITGVTQTASINCHGEATAAISIAIDNTQGQGPFVFNVKQYSDLAHTTLVKDFGTQTSGLPAGYYVITVTDAKGCTDTFPYEITQPNAITVTSHANPIICNTTGGGSKGSIIVDGVTGGSGTYTYYVTGVNGYNQSATSDGTAPVTFAVIDFGLYQINVVDANGCSKLVQDVKVASPPGDLDINVTPSGGCSTLSALVAVGASSVNITGSGPFHFAVYTPGLTYTGPTTLPWHDEDTPGTPGSKNATISGLIPGVTYTFIVHDGDTGCYYYEVATPMPTNSKVEVNTLVANNITCKGAADGSVTFTMTAPLYNVDTPVSYQIYDSQTVTAIGSAVNVIIPASGSFDVNNFNGGTTGLPFGNYFVLITELPGATNAGCTYATGPFNITESTNPLLVTASVIKNANCNEDGVIAAQAKDGTGPYTYQVVPAGAAVVATDWVNSNTFTKPGSLTGIDYDVHVKDAYGCDKYDTVTLFKDPEPTINGAPAPICYTGSEFTINLAPVFSATILPVTYSVNGSVFQTSSSFTFNEGRTYNLVIKDGNGCTANINYIVQPQLFLDAQLTQDLTCISNASITLTASGGVSPYVTYEVNDGSGYVASANPFTTATAGTYKFRVTDTQGCQAESGDITVTPKTTPTGTENHTAVSCTGGADGTITVTPANGIAPYNYTLTGSGSNTTGDTTGIYTGLSAGSYTIVVKDAKGCTSAAIPVNIAAPIAVTASASASAFSCTVDPTKTVVTVIGGGGTGTYTFSKDGTNYFASNSVPADNKYAFDLVDDGTVQDPTYWVKDSNGCIQSTKLAVPINPLPKLISVVAAKVGAMDCINNQQQFDVTINGGSNTPNPFTYQVYQDGVALPGLFTVVGNSFTYNAPTAGHYYEFKVIDNNTTCSLTSTAYDVPLFNYASVIASASANAKCNGDANGAIEINITGYSGPYNYEILKGGASLVPAITGTGDSSVTSSLLLPTVLKAGTDYTVKVTETAYPSCTIISNNVIITEPTVLDLTPAITVVNQNCNTSGAVITVPSASVTGGTRGYTYAFVPSGTPPTATDFTFSNTKTIPTTKISPAFDAFDVWVQDVNGCQDKQTVNISVDPMPAITAVVATQCPSVTGTYDITVAATSFNGFLEYSLDGNSFQSSNVFTVSSPGNYTVTVRDANQCTATWAIPVTVLEPLQLRADLTTIPTCLSANGEVTLTASGGTIPASYEYSQDGTNYVAGNVFSGLAPSVIPYIFYVRDLGTTCVKSVTVTITAPNTVIDFSLTKTDVTCNGDSDGTISVNLATPTLTVNNNPLYTYALNGTTVTATAVNVGPQNSPLFSGLPAGTYTVTVTSGLGCTATQTVSVVQPNPMVVSAPTVVPFGCTSGNAADFATITVNVVNGGSGFYLNYEFIKVGTPNTQVQFGSSNVYTEANLTGGSYIVNVYDSKGCIGTTAAPIVIDPFIELDKVNVVVNQAITCTNLEDITVTASTIGGSANNLQFTVQDVTYDNSTTPPATNLGAVYNLPPTSVIGNTATFVNLPIGNYLITVRNLDTQCEIQGVHYVNEPNTFDLTIDSIVDVICLGDANGSARVTLIDRVTSPTDEAGPFDYTVYDIANPLAPVIVVPTTNSPTFGPITLNGLRAGTYMISAALTNSPYCIVSKNFTITGPTAALAISETHTDITCVTGNNDGTITASATGGWSSDYEFELVGPVNVAYSAQTNFTGLTAGNYTVNVRDSKGCVATTTVNLSNPTPIVFTAAPSTTLLACYGDTSASITASVPTGGQGTNYLYTLNTTSLVPGTSNGPQASRTFNGLGAGTYTITVTDGYSCSATSAPITISEPAELIASLVVASTQTCLTQASLTLSATGGTGAYTYSADGTFAITGSVITSGSFTTSTTFSVPVGTYHYYVKDANGCVSVLSNDIEVLPLETLILNVDASNAVINCKGDLTGVIVATAQGGLGNYVYTLLDGAGLPIVPAPTQVTPGDFTGLAAGFYKVRVDSGDCNTTTVAALEIKEPLTAISETHSVVNVTCFGEGNGQIIMTASGGTGIIKYAISPRMDQFFESGTFVNLEPGLYDVLAQDENGCYIYLTGIAIIEPSPLTASLTAGSLLPEICFGDNDGAFSVDISGGTMPYSVSLDDKNGTYTNGIVGQTQFDFTGLAGGAHTVYVKDFNGCVYELIVDMPESVKIDPIATVDYGCVNNSASNSVTVTVDASITNPADVDYSLDGAPYQLGNVFTNVAPGVGHYIDVRHTNGCIQRTATFDIAQIDPLAVTLNDGGLNEIVATTTGGSGTYQYTFNGESTGTKNTFIYYKSGDYTVEVTDSNGCTVTATRYFEFIDIKIPNVFTPNGDGNNDGWTPTNTINYPDLVFHVFDRYGRKVGTFGEGQFWDGKYNGTELPTGDYWYVLKLKNDKDAREFVGHFTLYR